MNASEIRDALEGHGILSVETAQAVCETLRLELNMELVMHWSNQADAMFRYSFFAAKEGPGEGVDSLDLSYDLCKQLGIDAPGHNYSGRGFQGKANTQAILQEYSVRGEEL